MEIWKLNNLKYLNKNQQHINIKTHFVNQSYLYWGAYHEY